MLRILLVVPALLSVLLLAGCQSELEKKRAKAVELTSQAQQAVRRGTPEDFRQARVAIDEAIALEPTANRYWLRAETHMDDLPAALADLEKGLELEPNNNRLLRWKQSVEQAMGKKPDPKKP